MVLFEDVLLIGDQGLGDLVDVVVLGEDLVQRVLGGVEELRRRLRLLFWGFWFRWLGLFGGFLRWGGGVGVARGHALEAVFLDAVFLFDEGSLFVWQDVVGQ